MHLRARHRLRVLRRAILNPLGVSASAQGLGAFLALVLHAVQPQGAFKVPLRLQQIQQFEKHLRGRQRIPQRGMAIMHIHAQPVGDKPVNAARRSPRLNATYSYQFE